MTSFVMVKMKKIRVVPIAVACFVAGCVSDGDRLYDARLDSLKMELHSTVSGETNSSQRVESVLPKIKGEVKLLDAVNLALENNLSLRSAFLKREEAAGAIMEATSAAYPNVGLTGGITSDLKERGNGADVYGATWSITQPLWRSGAVSAGIRYAKLYAASTDEKIREQLQETVASVTEGFMGVLLARQMVNVFEESVGVAERMLETAKKKRNAGSASDYEVLRAEVEVASTKASLIKERNVLRSKTIELLRMMGVNQDSDIEFIGTLEYKPASYEFDALVETAMLHRPDILQAEAALRMANESYEIAKSKYGPSVDLFVNGKYQNPDPNNRDREEWNDDWSAGVQMSYTLFDGFERKGKLAQVRSLRRQAESNMRNVEEAARVEIARALLGLRDSEELYLSQAKNIDLSREALRMLENGHKVGKNTQIEVLDARSALTEAMGQYYNAIYAHEVAHLAVRMSTGTLAADATSAVEPDIQLDSDPL